MEISKYDGISFGFKIKTSSKVSSKLTQEEKNTIAEFNSLVGKLNLKNIIITDMYGWGHSSQPDITRRVIKARKVWTLGNEVQRDCPGIKITLADLRAITNKVFGKTVIK